MSAQDSDTPMQKNVTCAIAELDGQGFTDMADAVEQMQRELAASNAAKAGLVEALAQIVAGSACAYSRGIARAAIERAGG